MRGEPKAGLQTVRIDVATKAYVGMSRARVFDVTQFKNMLIVLA
jgi:hypothetical protein